MPRKISGQSQKVVQKPRVNAELPREMRREHLDFDKSFGIEIEEYTAVFIPSAGMLGKQGKILRLPKKSETIGIIVNCENEVWLVDGESTGEHNIGLIVYAPQKGGRGWRSHKPIMAGRAVISGDPDNYHLEFDLKTLYDNITMSPRNDSVSAGGTVDTDGKAKFEVKYTYEF